jgi:DNA-binding response OmpR family regulator
MTRPTLLLIDDAIHLTMLYQEELEDDGYDVDIANTVSQAYELIKKNSYDLIIIEPALKSLKEYIGIVIKLYQTKEVPILINTGSYIPETERRLWFVETVIQKTSDTSVLKNTVRDILFNNHQHHHLELFKGNCAVKGIG